MMKLVNVLPRNGTMTQEGTKTLISVEQMLIVGIKIKKTKTPGARI